MRRLLPVLAATLVFGGCGSEDDEANKQQRPATATSTPSPAGEREQLSRAEFTKEATRICRQGARESARLVKRELSKPSVRRLEEIQQRVHVVRVSEPLVRETMGKLDRLPAPREVEPDVKSMIRDVNESMAVLGAAFEAKSEEEGAELVARLRKLAASSRQSARQAGLQSCLPEQTP